MRPTTWAWPAPSSEPAAEPLPAQNANHQPVPATQLWREAAARSHALDVAAMRFGLRLDAGPSVGLRDGVPSAALGEIEQQHLGLGVGG